MVTFEAIKIKICVIKETISLNFRQDLRRFLIGHLSSPKKTKGHEEGNSNSFPVIRRRQHKDFCPVLVFETIWGRPTRKKGTSKPVTAKGTTLRQGY